MTEAVIKKHFIQKIIEQDLALGKHTQIITRFPPEPNGYLHIGHAKSIFLNFGMAQQFNGFCHLRFDDTNPEAERQEYIDGIQRDLKWLGCAWDGPVHYASDYFEQLYEYAVQLIKADKAYVCSLSAEEIRQYRGTLTEPGRNSPYRDRSVAENLQLFAAMRQGEFAAGEHVLRAKIDMASPNINLRDPTLYRIRFQAHPRTGTQWCIYPTYDYTHCLSDAIEGITHSLCTLEFEDHRPLYDWVLEQLNTVCKPQQIEFSRLQISGLVTSKRKLKQLVADKHVTDWDDPRLPTLSGMRRRGYPAVALREFCQALGITKADGEVELGMLEYFVRKHLDQHAPRAFCVLSPLKVSIINYATDQWETLQVAKHPKQESMGTRTLYFGSELWIDNEDFVLEPPPKYFRLAPGKEVRLRHAYVIRCEEVVKDPNTGAVVELKCSYDPKTLGSKPEGRKVKGVIQWLSRPHAVACQVNLYEQLLAVASEINPSNAAEDWLSQLNPSSLITCPNALVEPDLAETKSGATFQFERLGYFCRDTHDSNSKLTFNRTATLRDTWKKIQQQN